MLNPPMPPIPGAVGINHHDLIGAVGQVVPATLAAPGPVGVLVCLAAACAHALTASDVVDTNRSPG